MSNSKIYLCGPIADRTDEQCKDWREHVKMRFWGETVDPLRRDYRGVKMDKALAERVVNDDLDDIDSCTGVLIYYDKPSVGTSMEIFYAATTFKKTVLVNMSGVPDERLSPWLIFHVDHIVHDLESAMQLLA